MAPGPVVACIIATWDKVSGFSTASMMPGSATLCPQRLNAKVGPKYGLRDSKLRRLVVAKDVIELVCLVIELAEMLQFEADHQRAVWHDA